MEPRKMVLMNLFAGQEWRHRCREQICGHSKVSWGQNELRFSMKYIHYHV